MITYQFISTQLIQHPSTNSFTTGYFRKQKPKILNTLFSYYLLIHTDFRTNIFNPCCTVARNSVYDNFTGSYFPILYPTDTLSYSNCLTEPSDWQTCVKWTWIHLGQSDVCVFSQANFYSTTFFLTSSMRIIWVNEF